MSTIRIAIVLALLALGGYALAQQPSPVDQANQQLSKVQADITTLQNDLTTLQQILAPALPPPPVTPPVVPPVVATPTTSPEGTIVPPAAAIVDTNGDTWKLVNGQISKDNVVDPVTHQVSALFFDGTTLYQQATSKNLWWAWQGIGWSQPMTAIPGCQ